jgi:hypothetical protein
MTRRDEPTMNARGAQEPASSTPALLAPVTVQPGFVAPLACIRPSSRNAVRHE